MFTDTDSLTFEIKTNDFYENFYKNNGNLDFSEYSKN